MLALAVDAAVAVARTGDPGAFDVALAGLRQVEQEMLGVVLGAVVADLVETRHLDGLDGDDARAVLVSCLANAAWYPHVQEEPLVLALTGALGVHDPDEDRPADRAPVLVHGLLLVTDLLGADQLAPFLDRALRELHRAQTVELP